MSLLSLPTSLTERSLYICPIDHVNNEPAALNLPKPSHLTIGLLLAVAFINFWAIKAHFFSSLFPSGISYFMVYKLGLDREQAVPAWFATLLIAAAAVVCSIVAYRYWLQRRPGRFSVAIFAMLLWWVSLDENVSIHEHFSHIEIGALSEYPIFRFSWVIFGLAFVAVMAVILLPGVRHLDKLARRWLIGGTVLFCVGALGVEMVTGVVKNMGHADDSLAYFLCSVVEENCEMVGMVFILHGLVAQLRVTAPAPAIARPATVIEPQGEESPAEGWSSPALGKAAS